MKEQLYRQQRAGEFALSGGAILNGYEVDTDCGDSPHDPIRPVSIWRCNEECPCDEVRIRETYCFTAPPKERVALNCPKCGKPMQFWNYVSVGFLLRVGDNEPGVPEWLPKCFARISSAKHTDEGTN
jgi:hypothetical protein